MCDTLPRVVSDALHERHPLLQSPSPKRAKLADVDHPTETEHKQESSSPSADKHDICIFLHKPSILKTMVDIINSVLTEVEFRVEDDHLVIGMMDRRSLCLVDAKFNCVVNRGQGMFVKLKTSALLTCLRTIPSHYVVELLVCSAESRMILRAYESDGRHDLIEYSMATLQPICKTCKLKEMNYSTVVDIELSIMRSLVKTCKDLKASRITLSASQDNGRSTRVFNIEAWGDEVKVCRSFTNASHKVPQSLNAESSAKNAMICAETFNTEYLHLFMKSMDRKIITLMIDQDKPLVLECPFDTDGSYARFILAPKDVQQD